LAEGLGANGRIYFSDVRRSLNWIPERVEKALDDLVSTLVFTVCVLTKYQLSYI
jgi:hypothetical protein